MLDGQIEALLGERVIKAPQLLCGSSYPIRRFCINQRCSKDSLCCEDDQCNHCEYVHPDCSTRKLKQLTKKIQDRFFLHKKNLRSLFIIENQFINRLIANRKKIVDKSMAWRMQSNSQNVIEAIYFKNSKNGLKGKDMKKLIEQLQQQVNQQEAQIEQYLQSYKSEGQKNIQKLQKLREDLIQKFGKKQKQEKLKVEKKIYIPSKILTEDQQGYEKYSYMLKQLLNPTSLKLLFRASQHQFSAAKFHQCCDGVSSTITIVRTEFGKTIAAYTPLKWSADPQGVFVTDDSKSSFLLQLELKQKMILTKPQKAIGNHKNWGPIFGWNDLSIRDQSNRNQNSYSNFPNSYNSSRMYKRNQQSKTAFSGSVNGWSFRVLEWQVFAVVK